MLLRIPALLTPDEVRHCRQALEAASWQDGKATASLSLDGALGSSTADNAKIGTITVTLN